MGRQLKQNLPNGVMKVVSFADSGDRPVCQNPEFASSLLKLVIVSCRSETATGKIKSFSSGGKNSWAWALMKQL